MLAKGLIFSALICLVSSQDCFVPGECTQSSLISIKETDNVAICLDFCKDNEDCNWFTFVPYASVCELLADCGELDDTNCKDCISGQRECEAPKCDIPGLCQVSLV